MTPNSSPLPFAVDTNINAPSGGSLLAKAYRSTREYSQRLCSPLDNDDYNLQAMASTSPVKWHLAHTSWFFETFVLKPYSSDYRVFHPQFEYLFNSYYNGVGNQYPRDKRGLLSRPSVEEVYRYREYIDTAMLQLLNSMPTKFEAEITQRTELGCHHEQQHQELLLTDLKFCWGQNPLQPRYSDEPPPTTVAPAPVQWQSFDSQLHEIGHIAEGGFCFDNELPRHKQYVAGFRMADRLVSNGEYLKFIEDEGYTRADLWLADGWAALQEQSRGDERIQAPLYWSRRDGQWLEYTLHGQVMLDKNSPACHLSAYEADAYARWKGCRLPTEFEWEVSTASFDTPVDAPPSGMVPLHPAYSNGATPQSNINGCLWQWTSSAYSAYPGYKTAEGTIGEYNGKFMANQLVLRGGSFATSPGHYRHSYRNFFYPQDQWQFTGVRLAKDL